MESIVQTLQSPPKPTEAAKRPLREVLIWWQPSLCAFVRTWEIGISGDVVEWTWMDEAPDADRICVGVTAREKMSVMCATMSYQRVCMIWWLRGRKGELPSSIVCAVRYCLDCETIRCAQKAQINLIDEPLLPIHVKTSVCGWMCPGRVLGNLENLAGLLIWRKSNNVGIAS